MHHARYPSWEPTSLVIPPILSRALAKVYLAESRTLWKHLGWSSYAYVRALERTADDYQLTVVVVRDGHIVQRALLVAAPPESVINRDLDYLYLANQVPAPRLVWIERGAEIGDHGDGYPALTVDVLYDVCESEVLGQRPDLMPRLYFHWNGLLQYCGFRAEECPDCGSASIQVIDEFQPEARQLPTHYLCMSRYGAALAGMQPFRSPPCEQCRCRSYRAGSLRTEQDICRTDPDACPFLPRRPRAIWDCSSYAMDSCVFGTTAVLLPECTGQDTPHSPSKWWRERCSVEGGQRSSRGNDAQ